MEELPADMSITEVLREMHIAKERQIAIDTEVCM
jgi:hypothetical protein